jgi:hypothetical protein
MDGVFKREFFVILPLFGTGVAISFDVGYFTKLDINLFNVFSVSEHVAFALQLVPAIVLVSMIIIISSFAESYLKQKQANKGADKILMAILLAAVVVVFIASLYFRTYLLFFIVCVGFVAIGIVGTSLFVSRSLLQYNVLPMIAAMLIIVGAVMLGLDTASRHQNSRTYNYFIRTVAADLRGRVLRSGDRGLLIFEQTRGLMLLPWVEIKEVAEKKTATPPPIDAVTPL